MANMKKLVTIEGVNDRLCGNIYISVTPELPELKGISVHGNMHYLYLRMLHFNQLKGLENAGLLMQYLTAFDRKVKRYLRSGYGCVEIPSLGDPDFERKYQRYILVNRNIDSNILSKFILQGVHQDILQRLSNKSSNSQ